MYTYDQKPLIKRITALAKKMMNVAPNKIMWGESPSKYTNGIWSICLFATFAS